MTPQPEQADQVPTPVAPTEPETVAELVNPRLSANLRADYEALRNDVQQANELAADFQKKLAGKSNEFAILKQVFEKACMDLGHLQAGITQLREERHRLANEAMRATALQMKLTNVTNERDRLRAEMEAMRIALADVTEDRERALRQRDKQIAELTVQVASCKQASVEALARSGSHGASRSVEREPKTAASERANITGRATDMEVSQLGSDDDFIDISFEA